MNLALAAVVMAAWVVLPGVLVIAPLVVAEAIARRRSRPIQ